MTKMLVYVEGNNLIDRIICSNFFITYLSLYPRDQNPPPPLYLRIRVAVCILKPTQTMHMCVCVCRFFLLLPPPSIVGLKTPYKV
jgi:hypothetical protein